MADLLERAREIMQTLERGESVHDEDTYDFAQALLAADEVVKLWTTDQERHATSMRDALAKYRSLLETKT